MLLIAWTVEFWNARCKNGGLHRPPVFNGRDYADDRFYGGRPVAVAPAFTQST